MASISATSWLHTARNVRLQGSSTLAADLQQRDGSWTSAAFDLNEVLGNSNGMRLLQFIHRSISAHDCGVFRKV